MIRLNCAKCGKFTWKYPSKVKRAKKNYCSKDCYDNRVGKTKAPCNYCGKDVWHYKSNIQTSLGNVYCDKECFDNHHNTGLFDCICNNCGKVYQVNYNRLNRSKYCSGSCRMIFTQRVQGGIGSPGSEKLYPKTIHLREIVMKRRAIEDLKDHYIVSLIGGYHGLKKDDVPEELISLKRKQIILKRQIQ